jgi:hypothetical protein
MNFSDESVCLMVDNVWNEGKLNFVDRVTALCFTMSSVVRLWEFVYELSAVGGSFQLH